jgi:hypothetical protein
VKRDFNRRGKSKECRRPYDLVAGQLAECDLNQRNSELAETVIVRRVKKESGECKRTLGRFHKEWRTGSRDLLRVDPVPVCFSQRSLMPLFSQRECVLDRIQSQFSMLEVCGRSLPVKDKRWRWMEKEGTVAAPRVQMGPR